MQPGVNNHTHASNPYIDFMNVRNDYKETNTTLFCEWHENHDSNAREEIILSNLPMVYKLAQKYNIITYITNIYDMDDIISIGTIGLIKAVDTFDYTKGYAFTTYAYRVIQNHLRMAIRPLNRSNVDTISLDENPYIVEIIQDRTVNIEDSVQYAVLIDILNDKLSALNPKQRMMINLYYGIGTEPMTQNDIAEYTGFRQGSVSRIIRSALEILRKEILSVI